MGLQFLNNAPCSIQQMNPCGMGWPIVLLVHRYQRMAAESQAETEYHLMQRVAQLFCDALLQESARCRTCCFRAPRMPLRRASVMISSWNNWKNGSSSCCSAESKGGNSTFLKLSLMGRRPPVRARSLLIRISSPLDRTRVGTAGKRWVACGPGIVAERDEHVQSQRPGSDIR
jgi:hypothetical protein